MEQKFYLAHWAAAQTLPDFESLADEEKPPCVMMISAVATTSKTVATTAAE
jgi:hypothetical protein